MIIAFYRKRGYYVIVMYLTIMHLTIGDGRMITDDEVFPRLFSLIRQMHNLSKRNVKHSGMFLGRGRIIHILAMRDQPLSQRELADMANIKPGSLTEVLERLERDDLIKRERLAIDTSLRNYLIRSVRNRCTNYMSSRQRRRFDNMASIDSACRDVLSSAAHIQPPEIRLIEKELETIVSEAIENLPEECRKVFKASRFSHMTYNEIAEDFGISVNTVKYHMKQALAILSRKLEKYLIFIFLLMRLHS